MNIVPAGVDTGYGWMKIVSQGKRVAFHTVVGNGIKRTMQLGVRRVSNNQSQADAVKELDVIVTDHADGRINHYFFGELATIFAPRHSYIFDRNKVLTEQAKAAIFVGLALITEGKECEYLAVLGAPVGEYEELDTLYREAFPSSMSVTFNAGPLAGQTKKITIAKATVLPQGFGVYLHEILDEKGDGRDKKLLSKRCGVVDIGFRTSIGLPIYKSEPVDAGAVQTEDGMSVVHEAIKKYLKDTYNINEPLGRIEAISRVDLLDIGDGQHVNIKNVREQALRQVANNTKSAVLSKAEEWDLDTIDRILVAGGGGEVAFPFLDLPKKKLVPDAQLANALGYEKLAVRSLRLRAMQNAETAIVS
ncbi:MAG: hypothetical protein ACOY9Y_10445 [Bacillota bacterium]